MQFRGLGSRRTETEKTGLAEASENTSETEKMGLSEVHVAANTWGWGRADVGSDTVRLRGGGVIIRAQGFKFGGKCAGTLPLRIVRGRGAEPGLAQTP